MYWCSHVYGCSLELRAQISQSCQPGQILGPDQWMVGHASRKMTWIFIKDAFSPRTRTESLLSLMPSIHSLYLIANDLDGVTTVKEIAALMPCIRQAAKGWAGLSKSYLNPRNWHRRTSFRTHYESNCSQCWIRFSCQGRV